jgi:HEAT repeat protein
MMRLLTIPMILILVATTGCNKRQVVTQLEVGRDKLLLAGLEIEAIEHLKLAETKEAKSEIEKVEPRALLLIAYTTALSSGDAQTLRANLVDDYKKDREKRLAALNTAEMRKILDVLNERHRVQDDAMQVLIDKGSDTVPLLIESLGRTWKYARIEEVIEVMLYQIGSQGLDHMIAALKQPDTPAAVKSTLVELIGNINNPRMLPDLVSIRDNLNETDAGLIMGLNVALYKLGKKSTYKPKIIAGLSHSDVAVRRAASKALSELNDSPAAQIVSVLKDSDTQVRMYAAQALQKFPTETAVNPLINILKTDSDADTKQAATRALIAHAKKGLGKSMAVRLINELNRINDPNDRLRVVQILKTDQLKKQIKTHPSEDNLEYNLWKYFQDEEQNDMVKDELNLLLLMLESA